MYKEVLRSIDNISIYPLISLVVFIIFFIVMLIGVYRTNKTIVDAMAVMPISDDGTLNNNDPHKPQSHV